MRFKKLGPYVALMFVFGVLGVFIPSLVSVVIALAAVFVSGVVAVTGDVIVQELRKPASAE